MKYVQFIDDTNGQTLATVPDGYVPREGEKISIEDTIQGDVAGVSHLVEDTGGGKMLHRVLVYLTRVWTVSE